MKVGIVNYKSAGNIFSVINSLKRAGSSPFIIKNRLDFKKCKKIILPGVGYFNKAMDDLESNGFNEEIIKFNGHILGICLGMQLLADYGFEGGKRKGLGLIQGEVRQIDCDGPIPHMGFNSVIPKNQEIHKTILPDQDSLNFYFMHSYEFINYESIAGLTNYYDHKFVSYICKNKIHGVQFHPEKSGLVGIKCLENFLKL